MSSKGPEKIKIPPEEESMAAMAARLIKIQDEIPNGWRLGSMAINTALNCRAMDLKFSAEEKQKSQAQSSPSEGDSNAKQIDSFKKPKT